MVESCQMVDLQGRTASSLFQEQGSGRKGHRTWMFARAWVGLFLFIVTIWMLAFTIEHGSAYSKYTPGNIELNSSTVPKKNNTVPMRQNFTLPSEETIRVSLRGKAPSGENRRQLTDFFWPPTTSSQQPEQPQFESNVSSNNALPAVMVGVASSIILCTLALYLIELRHRCQGGSLIMATQSIVCPVTTTQLSDMNKQLHSRSSMQDKELGVSPSLPRCSMIPLDDHLPNVDWEDLLSLSPVSTMTGASDGGAETALEQDLPPDVQRVDSNEILEHSKEITPLENEDRISDEMDLSSLIKTNSSLTSSHQTRLFSGLVENSPVEEYEIAQDEEQKPTPKSIRINETPYYTMSADGEDSSSTYWTGLPDESASEVSVGTFLKSVHSRKSLASEMMDSPETAQSIQSTEEGKSASSISDSGLEGEGNALKDDECKTPTTDVINSEEDEDEDPLSLSPDAPFDPRAFSRKLKGRPNELSQLEQLCVEDIASPKVRKKDMSLLEEMLEGGRLVREYRCPGEEGESLEEATEIDDSTCLHDATTATGKSHSQRVCSSEGDQKSGFDIGARDEEVEISDKGSVGSNGSASIFQSSVDNLLQTETVAIDHLQTKNGEMVGAIHNRTEIIACSDDESVYLDIEKSTLIEI